MHDDDYAHDLQMLMHAEHRGVTGGHDVTAPESSASSGSVVPAVAPEAPPRPSTRLQHGISKPKNYTDGTVCWVCLQHLLQENPPQLMKL
jgi:hypothetical protein